MQREKFHGLTVEYTEENSVEWYELKATLEQTIKNLEKSSKERPNNTLIVGARLDANLQLTVCARNGQTEVGVYDKANKCIKDHIDSESLTPTAMPELERLEIRSQNVADAIKYDRQIPKIWVSMKPAWEKAIQERSRDSVSQEFDDRIKQAKQEAKQLSSGTNNIKVKGQEKER